MFRLNLFRIRAFTAGNIAGLLGALGRGGMQFMLIIWLQGIWLPQHGYSFSQTPLWAGIAMIPLTVGFLITGPLAGALSDRYGARAFATGGLIVSGISFLLLELLPINFNYIWFALLVFMFAVGMGLFFSPNQAAVMNSLPPDQRGAGAGMLNTFQNSATVLSMGLFFTIVTLGLAARLPAHLYRGLVAAGVSPAAAHAVASEPPIGALFSAFLGYNPIKELLGPTGALQHLPPGQAAYITGRSFFPRLIEQPFASGLHLAFTFAAAATAVAVVASALRGRRYLHTTEPLLEELAEGAAESAVLYGLDETAGLPGLHNGDPAGPGANGTPARPARTPSSTARTEAAERVTSMSGPAATDLAGSDPAAETGPLLGIGAAAARAGVSERALRYYQQLGLIIPACTTPGGLRRYSPDDIARVERIRELQNLLGLNLDEIAIVLGNEDRMAQIRRSYHDERTSEAERRRLTQEYVTLQESLRATVDAKLTALAGFRADLDARIRRARDLLAGYDAPQARIAGGSSREVQDQGS